jgi:membrane protease YdiL (CAAX protease family)
MRKKAVVTEPMQGGWPPPGRFALSVIWSGFVVLGFVVAGALLAAPAIYALVNESITEEWAYLCFEIGGCVAVWLAARHLDPDWRGVLGLRPFPRDRAFVTCLGLAVCLAVVGATLNLAFPGFLDPDPLPEDAADRAAAVASGMMVGPVCDELLFRGYLYHRLRPQLGPAATMLVPAVLTVLLDALVAETLVGWFGLVALSLPAYLLLGFARERLGSTWPCIVLNMILSAGSIVGGHVRL